MPDIPPTMQAVRITAPGGPEVLRVVEEPVPAPGPGEVLIKVAAAGLNQADILQREGRYPPPPGAPDIPGLEVAGRIVALGEGVTQWRQGDAVCALLSGGGYAQYAVTEAGCLLPVPDELKLHEAAALPEALFTVQANVMERAALRKGETFLVHGGAGGIGHIAVQMARERGARVFATAGTPQNIALCEKLGAELAINYRETDFEQELAGHLGKRGIDVVLDHIGGEYVQKHIRLAARNGRIVNIAYMKGAKVELDMLPVLLKWLTLTASTLRIRSAEEKRRLRDAILKQWWPKVCAGRIRPVIGAIFPLRDVRQAHRHLAGPHQGKIVLDLSA